MLGAGFVGLVGAWRALAVPGLGFRVWGLRICGLGHGWGRGLEDLWGGGWRGRGECKGARGNTKE